MTYVKNFFVVLFGLVLGLLFCEFVLHLYNPLPTRVKGTQIVLPINRSYTISNTLNSRLDSVITHTKNSLGFRGPDLPKKSESLIKGFAVGGSTTECYYLSDNKTWPYLLGQKMKSEYPQMWFNNAGLDGHSSFGHFVLVKDHLLKYKPNFIFFLIGVNDIDRTDLNDFERWSARGEYLSLQNFIWEQSEVFNLVLNFIRFFRAKDKELLHGELHLSATDQQDVSPAVIATMKEDCYQVFVPQYVERIKKLIDLCTDNMITPIFLTQPILVGEGIDPVTGIDLENIRMGGTFNGKYISERLKVYNEALVEVAREYHAPVIDLASEMPKSSEYFYDAYHFTNKGAEIIAEIVYKGMREMNLFNDYQEN